LSKVITGSCQCGSVRFQISGAFEKFFLCHCKRCRKDTGSAHAANLFSSTAVISWLQGDHEVKSFKIPETQHEKSFCSVCGSALPTTRMNSAFLVVPAGCLDDPIDLQPHAHICYSDRANWDEGLDQVQKLDGLPG